MAQSLMMPKKKPYTSPEHYENYNKSKNTLAF